jgi:hypothetical protein
VPRERGISGSVNIEVALDDAVHERSVREEPRLEAMVGAEVVEARAHRDQLHPGSGDESLFRVVSVERLSRLDALHEDADGGAKTESPPETVELLPEVGGRLFCARERDGRQEKGQKARTPELLQPTSTSGTTSRATEPDEEIILSVGRREKQKSTDRKAFETRAART